MPSIRAIGFNDHRCPSRVEIAITKGDWSGARVAARIAEADVVARRGHAVGVQHFIDDDDGYTRWLAEHSDEFVLNTGRVPTPTYLVLHRASCLTISRLQGGATRWTHDYIKFCGHRAELEALARREFGGEPRNCGICAQL